MTGEIDRLISVLLESDDFDDEEESAFEFKDVLGPEDKHEIFSLLKQDLLHVHGNVTRHSSHYVHENTTSCNLTWEWNWPYNSTENEREQQQFTENRIEPQLDELVKDIDNELHRWNRKIYREIEAAYNDHISEEQVAENILANEYEFEKDGTRENGGGFQYGQLSPKAQAKAREWWVNSELEGGDTFYAEPVMAEWRWLLRNKGFDGVEIAFSGFWSQGDGASFTAKSIDAMRYLSGPDPVDFPQQERDQLDESEEDEGEDIDLKDVYSVNRKPITHIETNSDYAEYQERVAEFLAREQVTAISGKVDQHGNTLTDEFSRTPCDVCRRPLAGSRIQASGYNPETRQVQHYEICPDCEYYLAYGKLDDMTMMDLKADPDEVQEHRADSKQAPVKESEDDDDLGDDIKDVLGEPPPQPTFTATSSWGEITAEVDDGMVVKVNLYPNQGTDEVGEGFITLDQIARFDVGEWRRYYGPEELKNGYSIDILDLGFWTKDGHYEPPDEEWRQEFARQRHERGERNIPGI